MYFPKKKMVKRTQTYAQACAQLSRMSSKDRKHRDGTRFYGSRGVTSTYRYVLPQA